MGYQAVNKDHLRLGQHVLKRWAFYERNINKLNLGEKVRAVILFQSLKELSDDELKLLAERYYKGESIYNYDRYRNAYTTVKPVGIEAIAKNLDIKPNKLRMDFKRIERKLGEIYTKNEEMAR